MFKYQVTTNFDESISLFEDRQNAIAHVRKRSRASGRNKTDYSINKHKS